MADIETREEIAELLKERCALRSVRERGKTMKPCPNFGPSDGCDTCSYDWVSIAGEVLKVAKVKRASYEKERDKTKELRAEVKDLKTRQGRLESAIAHFSQATDAFLQVGRQMAEKNEQENKDVREAENND